MTTSRCCLLVVILCLASSCLAAETKGKQWDPRQFGAKADATTVDTQAVQAAIDACAAAGGGAVRLAHGVFLSGAVVLRSNVALEIEADATLLGSRNRADYTEPASLQAAHPGTNQRVASALISGENLEHVAIRGPGKIDGSGSAFRDKTQRRPKAIMLVGCRDVLVEDVHMESAGSWMQHYRDCQDLVIRRITVFNHASFNNDGLDLDGCRNVAINQCKIDSDDDALVLKSLSKRPCENITISDCELNTHCNALKMGTESGGGFRNITIARCKVSSPKKSQVIYGKQRGLAGIALEIVDGGLMEKINVSDVTIDGLTAPIFVRLGDRGRAFTPGGARPAVGVLKDVVIRNVTATHCSSIGCAIAGLPGHRVQNVSLSNVRISMEGAIDKAPAAAKIRERPEAYPESIMFGTLPAYGFYCRHVEGLKMDNVELRFEKDDARPAVLLDDVRGAALTDLRVQSCAATPALAWLRQSSDVQLHAWRALGPTQTFLRVEGAESKNIRIADSALEKFKKAVDRDKDVSADAVQQ